MRPLYRRGGGLCYISLRDYSHIRMQAKRRAVVALVAAKPAAEEPKAATVNEHSKELAKVDVLN